MTVAHTSWPRMRGYETSGFNPRNEFRSLPQNPTIRTFSRISSSLSSGSGIDSTNALLGFLSTSAFTPAPCSVGREELLTVDFEEEPTFSKSKLACTLIDKVNVVKKWNSSDLVWRKAPKMRRGWRISEIQQTLSCRGVDQSDVNCRLHVVLFRHDDSPRDSLYEEEGDCADSANGMEQLGFLRVAHKRTAVSR